jgi:type II secretory pathway pseudopilin PulG
MLENRRNYRHEPQAGMLVPAGRWLDFRRASGFTYMGLLILVSIMGIVLAAAGEVWHTAQKREKEQELLFVGNQFRLALSRYYKHTPGKAMRYPSRLEELLQDPRYPGIQRYLRKIYLDPMTRGVEWGLITGPNGEIFGVHSLSEDAPLKNSNFRPADKDFEGKKKYSEWLFMYSGK